MDPRIQTTYDEAPRWAKLVLLFIIAIAAKVIGKDGIEDVFKQFSPKTPDWRRIVAGQKLLHWNGKSEEQIEAEVGRNGALEVVHALSAFGIRVERKPEPVIVMPAPIDAQAPVAAAGAPEPEKEAAPSGGATAEGQSDAAAPAGEPTGAANDPNALPEEINGVKVADLKGLNAKQIKEKVPGISPAAIKLITGK